MQTRRCVASLYCGRLVNRGGGQGQGMAGRAAAGKWLLRIWSQFTVSSISEYSYAQWRTPVTFFCRYKSWPCNCTTVGSSAAAGLLSGGLASTRNRRNRNGDSVAGWHQISVHECLCAWLRVWALLFSEVIMGSNSTLTWELEIVWSPQSCLDPRRLISAYLSR